MENVMALNHVDPFHGNGEVATPTPKGIAAAWNWLKAQVGNTHPGATRPFGMVSACAYSGAYPTGYGLYDLTCGGPAKRLFERKTATGFTHFQPSGVGNIEFFYNYLKVMPLRRLEERGTRWTLSDETARPGYYSSVLEQTGIKAELTAGRMSIMHRYTAPESGPFVIAIDLSAGGLSLPDYPQYRTPPEKVTARCLGETCAEGALVAGGFPIYFYLETDMSVTESGFWQGDSTFPEQTQLNFDLAEHDPGNSFGLYFMTSHVTSPAQLRIGFSFRDADQARRNMAEIANISFDQARSVAEEEWEKHLGRIRVSGGTPEQIEIFYSCLYHSLVKPTDCGNESPYWPEDTPYFVDFMTMWDIYKTQLPLLLALYPERAARLARFILRIMERNGCFPNGYLMRDTDDLFKAQAAGLAWHTLADAWFRKVAGLEKHKLIAQMRAFLTTPNAREFMATGQLKPYTHTIDLVCAFHAMAAMATGLGEKDIANELNRHLGNWRHAYDRETGLLREDSKYYEGTLWNYSFRPHPDMAGRIRLFANDEAFVAALDTFFGYTDIQSGAVSPNPDAKTFQRHIRDNRFEGLNNEPDMETPYTYIWAGRHDRTAEIVRAVMRYQYTTGSGGLPGNDDSGGLSSWYIWSALGIFPVSGRDIYLIGSPQFAEADIRFARGTFRIRALGNSSENIYVQRATLNEKPLRRAYLRIDEVESGGELTLVMGSTPVAWASARPPG